MAPNQFVRHLGGGDPKHDDVDLHRFLRQRGNQAILIVLVGRKIHVGAERIHGVAARERRDVREAGVVRAIEPHVVVLRHERVDHRRVIREIDRFVHVAGIGDDRRVRTVGEVRAGEVHLSLTGVKHHLPVVDAGGGLVAERNPRRNQHLPDYRVGRVVGVGAEIAEHPYRNARLPATDDLVSIPGIVHEPERNVDADPFVANHLQDEGAAIFERVVAQPFLCARRRRDRQQEQRYGHHTEQEATDLCVHWGDPRSDQIYGSASETLQAAKPNERQEEY
jgi:hypothetical protein